MKIPTADVRINDPGVGWGLHLGLAAVVVLIVILRLFTAPETMVENWSFMGGFIWAVVTLILLLLPNGGKANYYLGLLWLATSLGSLFAGVVAIGVNDPDPMRFFTTYAWPGLVISLLTKIGGEVTTSEIWGCFKADFQILLVKLRIRKAA